jgi:DMSO/TMAO reductase YedYZ heme-binding membrane subunit
MTAASHATAVVVTSSTPLWYATRATGLVALVLLTASMALGLLTSVRFERPALIATSLLRTRIGLRSWRLVHWTAYLCWPVAVLHGLGTGTDTPTTWVLVLTACCVLVIVALTLWRLARAWPTRPVASARSGTTTTAHSAGSSAADQEIRR